MGKGHKLGRVCGEEKRLKLANKDVISSLFFVLASGDQSIGRKGFRKMQTMNHLKQKTLLNYNL